MEATKQFSELDKLREPAWRCWAARETQAGNSSNPSKYQKYKALWDYFY
jgi:hypothetical protein